MKKKECPACAMVVDANKKSCPVCGYEFTKQSSSLRWIALVLATALLLMYLFL